MKRMHTREIEGFKQFSSTALRQIQVAKQNGSDRLLQSVLYGMQCVLFGREKGMAKRFGDG